LVDPWHVKAFQGHECLPCGSLIPLEVHGSNRVKYLKSFVPLKFTK
jgi:hypothetical protein